jgi:hypothetical protein
MTLVQRSRFSVFLKNLTGFRGPFGMSLDQGVTPSYDFSRPEALYDDEVAFWWARLSVAQVAAQFSFGQIKVPNAGTRAVVDHFYFRAIATGTVHYGIAPDIVGATVATTQRNPFLSPRPPSFTLANASLGAVVQLTGTSVADPLNITPSAFGEVDITAGAAAQQFDEQFVITPGWPFVVAMSAVNVPLEAIVFGRYLGDQT